MKTEVYSWRVSTELKSGLEREARRRNMPVSAVIDQAVRDWLSKSGAENDNDEQLRIHKAALKCLGAFASGNAHRSENVRQTVRQRLRRSYDR